ncbi:hypothetical protein C8N43_1687 [Litoreibacter ponti]|uniref:Uncharacterized protein n=1 Tax=Litoreibacter ponti TaxID=1510457 RepID=A0A2T6BLU2_9RHOB|nr:hypothetical protein [Litoreibacter ponti]PTX57022.1 hypothetical protein C8N43_1687 [Litoreibacter ponti]
MALVLSPEVIRDIRFETLFETYHDMLMRHDKPRFRGLGHAHTERFMRHAITYCDTHKIHSVNGIGYVMFLMTYLGSYFYMDFRHREISAILEEPAPGFDNRIDRARTAFLGFVDSFLGTKMELYAQDLARFTTALEDAIEADAIGEDEMIALLLRSHGDRAYRLTPQQRQVMVQNAGSVANGLGLTGRQGLALALGLGYWLGFGVHQDPLYPWLRDKAQEEDDPAARTEALTAYALKRLKRQVAMLKEG